MTKIDLTNRIDFVRKAFVNKIEIIKKFKFVYKIVYVNKIEFLSKPGLNPQVYVSGIMLKSDISRSSHLWSQAQNCEIETCLHFLAGNSNFKLLQNVT